MLKYVKYHGLGNDYIVVEGLPDASAPTADEVRLICHRNYGVGSDGILVVFRPAPNRFSVRILNPDGGEAEKSGNGLRIVSRYLWDSHLVSVEPFEIDTKGGAVRSQVHEGGKSVTVEMGQVSFDSRRIPVAGPAREVLGEDINVLGRGFKFCAATVGNPHCVILADDIAKADVLRYGPAIENEARFPNRTNVQFMRVLDRNDIAIEIWERGAGYTLASGSSSCAAAAVARKLGLCDGQVQVRMPGGCLQISIGEDWHLSMTGPVVKVCEGTISQEMFTCKGEQA